MTNSRQISSARLILLGASNLTKGVSRVLLTARKVLDLDGPLDAMIAYGHGRSYGKRSTVLVRSLPGIVGCGLWDALENAPPAPTYGLITDVGNDVMYGETPEKIIQWVETCVDRLEACEAKIVLTGLPLESLRKLSKSTYRIAKALLFPRHDISFEQAIKRTEEVDQRLRELARSRNIPLINLPGRWYGFDPIHIRPGAQGEAWLEILAAWSDQTKDDLLPVRESISLHMKLRRLTWERWHLLGLPRGRKQPCARLADQTTVAMY